MSLILRPPIERKEVCLEDKNKHSIVDLRQREG